MAVALVLAVPWSTQALVTDRQGVAGLPPLRWYRHPPPGWIRPRVTGHTEWCTQDYRCGLGEHRSDPLVWRTGYGRLIATRVERGGDRLELLLSVRLPDQLGGLVARWLTIGVDLAVRAILGGHLGWLRPVYRRVTGTRRQ